MSSATKPKTTTADTLPGQLAYLRLPFVQEHYEPLAMAAAQDHWGHVDYLAKLVEGEALERQQRSIQRRIRQAHFPVIKTLESFQWTWPRKINRLQVQNLFRLKFIENKANVILLGGVGLGKTHLATALGYAACLKGHSVRFATAVDVINTLAAAHNTGRLKQELNRYLKPTLIVLTKSAICRSTKPAQTYCSRSSASAMSVVLSC